MNNSTLVTIFSEPQPIFTDDVRRWIINTLDFVIFTLGLLGTVTNGINIRVFIQQGLSSDSNTIGLFALSVADLLGSFFLIPHTSLCQIMQYAGAPVQAVSCQSMTTVISGLCHLTMTRISCWITVYIALERCLCVLIPFKVKMLIRPRVTTVAMVIIYVSFIVFYIPLLTNVRIAWRFYSPLNATVAFNKETEAGKEISKYTGFILNTLTPSAAVFIVAIATGLMLYKLTRYKKWREKTASAGSKDSAKGHNPDSKQTDTGQGKRDIEVLKMVLMVTVVFLVCLSASLIPGFASAVVPGFSITGLNRNLFIVLYWYKYTFDLINSSMNFFFYIRISSRYKTAFNIVFRGQEK